MKNVLLIVGLVILALTNVNGQDTIRGCSWLQQAYPRLVDMNTRDTVTKYFYIDSLQTNNIWQLGKPSKPVFDSAYSKPLALVTDTLHPYPINNTSSFIVIDNTDDCNFAGVDFWHRFNTDS